VLIAHGQERITHQHDHVEPCIFNLRFGLGASQETLLDAILDDAPDEVDEFGRNVNIGKRREAEARR